MRSCLVALALMGLTACDSNSDNARSVSGPGIDVHCDAATPVGATTVKVVCPTEVTP